jgi:3-isopropylmalate/(R)-2-methylmalate dehydratase small subunit
VSSFFADIFRNNCLNVGVLPVQVSAGFLEKIFEAIEKDPEARFEINLPEQSIRILATGQKEVFDINKYKKDNMLNGFDDIDFLLNLKDEIKKFEINAPL